MSFLGAPPPLPGRGREGRGGGGRGRGGRGIGGGKHDQYYKSLQGQLRLHAQAAAEEATGWTEVGMCGWDCVLWV